METTFKIFALLSPFIAAALTYFLSIKGKKKDIDIEKEKELNTILSNLLNVWHYLSQFESINEIISNEKIESIFPKEYLPGIMLNTSFLNDNCFKELDSSNEQLKKYDPITYYKLEGLGNAFNSLRKQYIMPFFNNSKLSNEFKSLGTQTLLNDTLRNIEENLEIVANKINKKTAKEVTEFIENYTTRDPKNILKELNQKYYEMMVQDIFPNGQKPTFEEFKEICKTDEFKQIQQMQMKIIIDGKLTEVLNVISNNPDISIEELTSEIEKNNAKHSI